MLEYNFPRSEKERNKVVINFLSTKILMHGSILIPPFHTQTSKVIKDFLKKSKFRKIKEENGVFTAERGYILWSYLGGGDPRRSYHNIKITRKGTQLFYTIESRGMLLSSSCDINVFDFEMEVFKNLIQNGTWDTVEFKRINSQRKKVDFISNCFLLLFSVLMGLRIGFGILFIHHLNQMIWNF